MDDEFKVKLEDKLNKISENIVEIKITLGKQEENIKHHIYRTDLLESKVDILKDDIAKSKGAKDFLVFSAKIGSFVVAAIGIILTIMKRFS